MLAHLQSVLPPSARVNARGRLEIGGCDVVQLADAHGTPLVVYDAAAIRDQARAFRDALAATGVGGEVVYASKAYFGRAALALIAGEGLAVDVASGGELAAALRAGVPAGRIHLHGNNKGPDELAAALDAGVGTVVVDNHPELDELERQCARRGHTQDILLRITPGVEADTHHRIATGQVDSKFGFPLAEGAAHAAVRHARATPHLALRGLHVHLGSQLLDLDVFPAAADVMARFAAEVGAEGLDVMDMGGGLGIAYTPDQRPPAPATFVDAVAGAVVDAWTARGLPVPRVTVEPGRSVVGRAGVHLYRVGAIKDVPGVRTYAAVDGGMSDLLRPMLYDAVYSPLVASRADAEATSRYRLVGKHCESGDVLVADAHLPQLERGDVVCVPATGAYGLSMASNYNGQPRPAVVFAEAGDARLVTRRETYDDVFAREL